VSIVQDLMLGALRGDQVSVGFRAHDWLTQNPNGAVAGQTVKYKNYAIYVPVHVVSTDSTMSAFFAELFGVVQMLRMHVRRARHQ
jgi:hypothetical protein